MRRVLALVVLALFFQGSTPPRVAIIRVPFIVWDDEAIVIMVQVEPHPANRALIVSAVEDGLAVRSSLEALDGDKAPRTRWVRWNRLAAGELHLVASVYTSEPDAVARAMRPIRVLARRAEHE